MRHSKKKLDVASNFKNNNLEHNMTLKSTKQTFDKMKINM